MSIPEVGDPVLCSLLERELRDSRLKGSELVEDRKHVTSPF